MNRLNRRTGATADAPSPSDPAASAEAILNPPGRPNPLAREGTFYTATLLSAALALGLFVHYAAHKEPFKISKPVQSPAAKVLADTRVSLPITVTAQVTNRTSSIRCPDLRVAARDVNDKDLASLVPAPLGVTLLPGQVVRMAPHQTLTFRATITTISAKDEREKLSTLTMYVYSERSCPPA